MNWGIKRPNPIAERDRTGMKPSEQEMRLRGPEIEEKNVKQLEWS